MYYLYQMVNVATQYLEKFGDISPLQKTFFYWKQLEELERKDVLRK